MRKHLAAYVFFFIVLISSSSCVALSEEQRRDYGVLESAVTFSSDKVIGEYPAHIPDDFDGKKFMEFVKDKIPEDYYKALEKYPVDVNPRGTYYLLLVHDPESQAIILFDYSCTSGVDGPVLLDPIKYDVKKIESFDTCGKP